MRRILVIGVGNNDRGDDAAGREAARRLRLRSFAAEIVELEGEATAILAALEKASAAYLVDACASGGAPGRRFKFDASKEPVPAALQGLSSHGFGVADAIELARALGALPRRCVVHAIEGQSFEFGAPLSAPVLRAVEEIVEELALEIAAFARQAV